MPTGTAIDCPTAPAARVAVSGRYSPVIRSTALIGPASTVDN